MKEERPFKKGPFPFFKKTLLSIFLFLTFYNLAFSMEVYTLDNKLQYIFEERKNTGVVAVQIWVRVGSWHEHEKIAGITHFIEHLIFKGTERLKANEMPSRIEALGGRVNAFTSYDNTVYHIVIPKNAFKEGFELLADAVNNPTFPEEEVLKEKKVILEEIKMGEDDPQRKLFKELFALSYSDIPYGRPIIGYDATVKEISRKDIIKYYKTHYIPENIVVVVVGDFNKEEAKELIMKHFSKRLDTGSYGKDLASSMKKEKKTTEKIIERDVKENYLAISYRIPSVTHSDIPALDVLSVIMGSGDSSRLNEQLKYKKGIVTGIGTDLFIPRYDGLFLIYSTFFKDDYKVVVKEIENEFKRLRESGIEEWELIKAKNMISSSIIYSYETAQGRAMQMGKFYTLTDRIDFVENYLKAIEKVTEKDIEAVLSKYILGKEKNIVVLQSAKKKENPYTFKLKNNMRCVVNVNKNSPSFAFRIGFIGGLKEEPPQKNGIFNVLSRMLLKGTSKKDASTIAKEIDILAGDITPFSGKNTFGLTGKFLSKDLKTVIRLLGELIRDSVFKEEELERVKDEVLSEIRQKEDDPISFTFKSFREAIFENHPYSRDPDGNERDVKGITVHDLNTIYKKYVTPEEAVLAISGDVDESQIRALFEEYFSDFKGEKVALLKMLPAQKRQEVFIKKEMAQRHLIFGFLAPGIIDKDKYAIEVMAAILSGMGGRIHRILREENPFAYALTFFNRQNYEIGTMGIYIGTDERYINDVKGIAREELKRIAKEGFTSEEIKNAKTRLIGNKLINMQSNQNIATEMCLDTIYGLGPDYFKKWSIFIEQVTDGDVNNAAKKYIDLDKMVLVEVGG